MPQLWLLLCWFLSQAICPSVIAKMIPNRSRLVHQLYNQHKKLCHWCHWLGLSHVPIYEPITVPWGAEYSYRPDMCRSMETEKGRDRQRPEERGFPQEELTCSSQKGDNECQEWKWWISTTGRLWEEVMCVFHAKMQVRKCRTES